MLFRWRSMDQCRCTHTPIHQQTNKPTWEERTILLKNGTLWANVLGIFSRAPAAQLTIRYGETSSLPVVASRRRLAPHYYTVIYTYSHSRYHGSRAKIAGFLTVFRPCTVQFFYRKSYGSVRCGFKKAKILRCGSMRFSDVVNPTVRFGAVLKNRKSYGVIRCGFQKS